MNITVSDFLIQRLNEWGIRRIYGYPGDGINGIIGAIGRAGDKVDYIQVRHEEMAAFMACAHSKFTGEVGVCLATSGPGAIHLLNGLYDAKMDHQSVVAIVGQQARMAMGGNYQQEVDLVSLFKDVAGEYVHMATVARADASPGGPRRPHRQGRADGDLHHRAERFAGGGRMRSRRAFTARSSAASASASRALSRVTRICGAPRTFSMPAKESPCWSVRARWGRRMRSRNCGNLGAGVSKALLGKAVIPDDSPGCCGSIGLLGTKPSWEMMMNCDTLLMVGSSFPYSEFLPKEGQARGVQIEIDGKMPSIRYPMEVPPHRRQRGNIARADSAAQAQDRPLLAREDRKEHRRLVERCWKPGR